MKETTINTVVYRTYGNALVQEVISKMKQSKIACEVATATVWRHGLPRTEHTFSTSEADAPQAKSLLRHLPLPEPEPTVSREKKLFIVSSLVVICVVAVVRLIRLFRGL